MAPVLAPLLLLLLLLLRLPLLLLVLEAPLASPAASGRRGHMEEQAREPVVRVPVLSKATVLQRARASRTRPPLIRMPLQVGGGSGE